MFLTFYVNVIAKLLKYAVFFDKCNLFNEHAEKGREREKEREINK